MGTDSESLGKGRISQLLGLLSIRIHRREGKGSRKWASRGIEMKASLRFRTEKGVVLSGIMERAA